MSDLNVLRQEYETLSYRTKALKNYALSELLQLYEKVNMIGFSQIQNYQSIKSRNKSEQWSNNYRTDFSF